ncbi:MAG TPA: DUF2059 domain-containing protein, partial [Xanthobacteraceae bacterium]|nr:DUF2059 domain-containing protein [Xanthobacteraceae bacterium]
FAVAIVLAVASSSPVPSHAQAPSPRSMEAAQALFGLLFAHGFVSLNATQAVDLAWPGIEGAVRAQKPSVDAATLAELRREFERIRLARLREITKDPPAIYARYLSAEEMEEIAAFYSSRTGAKMLGIMPKALPEAFASVLPRIQAMTMETQDSFMKLLRERGLLN